jgi:SPP1 family predicted phage head-tail adaptor
MPLHHVLAGQYNRRVTIQKPTVGTDSEGSPKTVWSTLDTVSAKIEPLSARERIAAAQAQLDVTDSVTIRYRNDMASAAVHNYRVLYSGRVLEIKEVIPDEARRVDMQLICLEMQV